MNGQVIRYLALNGPSLIYSVATHLASRSQTKVHYPTVNRRMHELVSRQYIQKAGTRTTKAGIPADLYANTIRGDFAALAGTFGEGENRVEASPKEMQQMITKASLRPGSPFVLLECILDEGQIGSYLVNNELVPELVKSVRNGYLNLDALDEGVICSAFASLVSSKVTSIMADSSRDRTAKGTQDYVGILMRSLEKMMGSTNPAGKKLRQNTNPKTSGDLSAQGPRLTPVSLQWVNELKVFLRLHSVGSG